MTRPLFRSHTLAKAAEAKAAAKEAKAVAKAALKADIKEKLETAFRPSRRTGRADQSMPRQFMRNVPLTPASSVSNGATVLLQNKNGTVSLLIKVEQPQRLLGPALFVRESDADFWSHSVYASKLRAIPADTMVQVQVHRGIRTVCVEVEEPAQVAVDDIPRGRGRDILRDNAGTVVRRDPVVGYWSTAEDGTETYEADDKDARDGDD